MHHHTHPYYVQTAAFFIALLPFVLLFTLMTGAQYFEGVRRARKPAPARRPGIVAITTSRALLSTAE
jgi:hypothetical protein